ncbi:hypothetical protein [Pseudoalteromonas shioyasakiensis]|uniref:hypothetical protein n=1 Tax=Pseudoalteromonas shioyasakiensis TaxID=1190813 RepID=UPI001C3DF648|nr:hypothetical protein [Pseudoalteromonas shioyasakiensis]
MEHFRKKAKENLLKEKQKLPDWVKDENHITFKAFMATEEEKESRLQYISKHFLKKDYKNKLDTYKIAIKCIADKLSIDDTTLGQSSSYSEDFVKHLKDINEDLEKAKNKSIEKGKLDKSEKKSYTNAALKKEISKLKQQLIQQEKSDVEKQVNRAFDMLSKETKEALTIPSKISGEKLN